MDPIEQIQSLINEGQYLEASQVAKAQLKLSGDLKLKQIYSLALSKSGAPEAARDFLEPVYSAGDRDPETAGILGSIYKELFRKNQTTAFATNSRDTYFSSYQATGSYYTGINAASMSAMLMQSSKSKEIARQLIEQMKDSAKTFWEVATLAEAYLLVKERQLALNNYSAARKMAGSDWGLIMSVHRQLWLLSHYISVPKELLILFEPPRVAAFVGHMIDKPDRATTRFPPSIEAAVAGAINENIKRLKLQTAYCSLACGADILFAEAMVAHGGSVNIILPFDVSDFVEQSVRFAGEQWVERFQSLARKLPVSFVTSERYAGDDNLFSLQGKIILGSAILQSHSFQSDPILLSVLSRADLEIKEGGTRNIVNSWPFPKNHVNVGLELFGAGVSPTRQTTQTKPNGYPASALRFLIRLSMSMLSSFEREKLLSLIDTKAQDGNIPCQRTSDEDHGVILSFNFETGAIEMLKTLNASKDFKRLSIALHAGPVQLTSNLMTGSTADQLRRIASYSHPGHILASGEFSALLALLPGEFQVEHASVLSGVNEMDISVYKVESSGI